MPNLRGADIVVQHAGTRRPHRRSSRCRATTSCRCSMPRSARRLELMHVRHEAASVHMADAYGRLTGRPGVAWVTGGPGHANAVGALFTALGQETPMVLLSGHTETDQLGRGGFQELRQVEMAAPVSKGVLDGDRHRDGRHGCRQGDPHRDLGPARDRCISACRRTCWTRRCPSDAVAMAGGQAISLRPPVGACAMPRPMRC